MSDGRINTSSEEVDNKAGVDSSTEDQRTNIDSLKKDTTNNPANKIEKNEGQSITAESIGSLTQNIITNINQSIQQEKLEEIEAGIFSRFSIQSLKLLSLDELLSTSRKTASLAKKDLIQGALRALKEHNILFLIDNETGGARQTAIRLACELSLLKAHYICEALNKYERINLIEDFESLKNTAIIFKSATKRENIDIVDFIDKIERSGNRGLDIPLIEHLKKRNTYFIIILDFIAVKPHAEILKCHYTLQMPSLSEKDLQGYLQNSLNELIGTIGEPQQDFITNFPADWLDSFAMSLRQIDKVDSFVAQMNEEFLINNVLPTYEHLKHLVLKTNDLSYWLIEIVGKHLQSWNFVFSITLLHNFPNVVRSGISLFEFELFRGELEAFQKRQFLSKNKSSEWPGLYPEVELIKQNRTIKNRDVGGNEFRLGFKEDNYSEEIWSILFNDLTINLIQIIPFLLGLFESNKLPYQAARILGRIGIVDTSLTKQLMYKWSNSMNSQERILVGYFLEGVLASNQNDYINFCQKYISNLGESNNFNQLWCAISAYSRIGLYELPKAIDALGNIVEKKISPAYEEKQKLEGNQAWEASKVNKQHLHPSLYFHEFVDLINATVKNELLKEEIEEKEKEFINHYTTIARIISTISGLCLNLGCPSVFKELHKWWQKDKKSVKLITVKMLLNKPGILDQLNYSISHRNDSNTEWENWHKVVLDISAGGDSLDSFIALFADVVQSFPDFGQGGEGRYYEKRLIEYLEALMNASLENERANDIMVELYGRMLLEIKELTSLLEQKLNYWTDSNFSNLKIKTFATKVRSLKREKEVALKELGGLSLGALFS
ncbi:MAG: hypothetical protein ACKV1O_28455 [Saprospiraceae bacterium]